jgi:glyoxylase-like metal-dependent hydrolase (beta-lactamase superfamily II)
VAEPIPFVREIAFEYGHADTLTPLIRRVVAKNPGAFTFHGTGTYIVGRGEVAVIDPGPALDAHVQALLAALEGERVSHILITHTHLDHSPAARPLQAATGAPTYGFGPHGGGRDSLVEEGGDMDFVPDVVVKDGDVIRGKGWTMEAIHTPGHTSNHLCFALKEENVLFSGDHVMGWSTTVVSPPDGDMRAYMASLDKLLRRGESVFWPTHGPEIREPKRFVRALAAHRRLRETQIEACVRAGLTTIPAMVERMYAGVPRNLHGAAAHTVLAHIIHMVETGRLKTDGLPSRTNSYRLPANL